MGENFSCHNGLKATAIIMPLTKGTLSMNVSSWTRFSCIIMLPYIAYMSIVSPMQVNAVKKIRQGEVILKIFFSAH